MHNMFTEIKTMSNTNKSINIFLILFSVIIGGFLLAFTPRVFADAAGDACKKEKSGQPKRACEYGYNEKRSNPNNKAKDICKKYTVEANEKACLKGAGYGYTANKKELEDSNNKVTLQDGTDPKLQCGEGKDSVNLRIDLGCQGALYTGPGGAIGDMLFSIIRFLSVGVGIVVAGSIIVAGIQYTTSEGNPEATQQAKNRIQMSVISLIVYIFIFAIVQFLVPGGFFS